jgi:RNA polymerase sigma-70 factor (ECF subfamily)
VHPPLASGVILEGVTTAGAMEGASRDPNDCGPETAVFAEQQDEALMLAIAKGNHAAFAVLARRHTGRAIALARSYALAPGDQEDVAQDALIRVWKAASGWDPARGARFATWFHRIVANLCIDRCRAPRHAALEAVPEPPSEALDAPALIAQRQSATLLATLLRELPERQRAALTLCYFDDHTAAEAGKVLGMSTGSVETMLSRTRRLLRTRLQALGIVEGGGDP